jgi:hypothetical protein
MTHKEAEIRRWLGQIYNNRGQLDYAAWVKFAKFCEREGFMDDAVPGKRLDGQDPWDILQENLMDTVANAPVDQ